MALLLNGASDVRQFRNFDFRAVNLPAGAAAALAQRTDVTYVSINKELRTLGHVSATTGADAVRATAWPNASRARRHGDRHRRPRLRHRHRRTVPSSTRATACASSRAWTSRARVAPTTLTGTERTSPPSPPATAASRTPTTSASRRTPTSSTCACSTRRGPGRRPILLRALDWVLTNRARYNIRVVNLSLGMPAIESYRDDPACQAVRRLVDAGIVVVAAAGNNGKDSAGNKVYGHIHSPGNEPSALTVGAANTFGTDARGDDGSPPTARAGRRAATARTPTACATTTTSSSPTWSRPATRSSTPRPWTTTSSRSTRSWTRA